MMKKWTTTTAATATGGSSVGSSVSLQQVLDVRSGPLNEVECWSILGQTGHALQDLLLSVNRLEHRSTSALLERYRSITITPQRLLCCSSGKVLLQGHDFPAGKEFQHPVLGSKIHLNEKELEAVGIYSLGRTIEKCLSRRQNVSEELLNLISGMLHPDFTVSVSLLDLLQSVTERWRTMVGSSPISRFVSQLCKVTLGWQQNQKQPPSHSSCSSIALTNHDSKSNLILNRCLLSSGEQVQLPPLNNAAASAPLAEVEFSRLDTSSSSSCAEDSVCSDTSSSSPPNKVVKKEQQKITSPFSAASSMPDLSSPPSNINNNNQAKIGLPQQKEEETNKLFHFRRGQYGRRLDYQPSVFRASTTQTAALAAKASIDDNNAAGGVYENVQITSSSSSSTNLERSKSCSVQVPSHLSSAASQERTRAALAVTAAASRSASKRADYVDHHRPAEPSRKNPSSSTARVQRNPSRLYRVVRPLTEIAPTPSPATKRCVGPEFVVMAAESDNRPIVMDLASHSNSRKDITKQVCVVMLNGQRILVHCSPASITAGEILDNVLSNQDIKESCYYSLALKAEDEYWIMSSDTKLHKVAPSGWREPAGGGNGGSRQSFDIYLRFKYLPDSVDAFKDPNNKHQLYLQLRRDVIEGRYHMPAHNHLSLAAMALQTEFGDFSEEIHGDGEYFVLEHYLPEHVVAQVGSGEARRSLTKLHRAHLGQSQCKTELRYCKEIQRLDNYGFQCFAVRETKKPTNLPRRHLGVHLQGIFLFETTKDKSCQHKILASFYWHNITRIQYDKCRFQLSVRDEKDADKEKTAKIKFYVSEVKSKLMFDLSSAHHQFYIQQRWNNAAKRSSIDEGVSNNDDDRVEYREPREKTIRSLKNRLLSKKQLSQRKLYTKSASSNPVSSSSSGMRRSSTSSSNAKLMVKRLTHYTSMADALAKGQKKGGDLLDVSDKENQTPNTRIQSYRYKVYLEPHDDDNPESTNPVQARIPLQEKPIPTPSSTPPPPPPRLPSTTRRRITTLPSTTSSSTNRRRSESMVRTCKTPSTVTTLPSRKSVRRSIGGTGGLTPNGLNLRMGTRVSLSALHRERLRLTTELGPALPPAPKMMSLDLDYGTMEFKSLMPKPPTETTAAYVVQSSSLPYEETEESLSNSLIERFDNMESEDTEPERQIVSVTLTKQDQGGRLGLKITGTPSGIYIDEVDRTVAIIRGNLKLGDRIVAINGRSLENVNYAGALELIRKSSQTVEFLVSQIKN